MKTIKQCFPLRRSTYTIYGNALTRERKIWFLPIHLYTRAFSQVWNPKTMQEIEFVYGIRIGSFRISVSRNAVQWLDGHEPSWEWKVST